MDLALEDIAAALTVQSMSKLTPEECHYLAGFAVRAGRPTIYREALAKAADACIGSQHAVDDPVGFLRRLADRAGSGLPDDLLRP